MVRVSAITFFCLVLAANGRILGDEPFERNFRMGFTGFPHDMTLPAVVEARKFCRENGDIIAHHIKGVAWTECLKGQPLPEKRVTEWTGKKEALAGESEVYLAVSPGRGGLQPLKDCQPIAAELKGKPYDDPLVMKAYLSYCQRMIEFFNPDYLAIGIEVNDIYKNAGPDTWRAYVTLHKHVYESLKRDHENLPIFASMTLHNLLNAQDTKRQEFVDAFAQIMPYCDLVGVSYYPFIQGGTTKTAEAFEWLTSNFGKYKKPYAVVETGEAAQQLTFPSSGQTIHGSAEKQYAYAIQLLYFAQANDCRFVVWFIHRDYDAMWQKMEAFAPDAHMAWRDCGLQDEAGKARPAMQVWKKYFYSKLQSSQ